MNFLLLNLFIALLFTSATTFLIGVFVLIKSKGNKTNKIFALYSFSIAGWAFCQSFVINASNEIFAYKMIALQLSVVWFIPTLFVHFVISFLNLKGKQLFLKITYALSFIFLIFTPTRYMATEMIPVSFINYWADPGIILHFAFAFFVIMVFYGLYELFKEYTKTSGIRHNQLAYLFWPSLLGYIGGGANFLFFYNISIPVLMPFGTYFVGFYVLAVTYAILKYQLMDIRVFIKKAFFYSVGIALISGVIFGVSFLNSWLTEHIPGFKFWMIPLIAGIVAFIVGNLFWQKSKEVDKLKYEFITVAAHKLRTPLTEVRWGLDALKDKEKDTESRQLVNQLQSANTRLIALTDELLSIVKTEAGQYQYSFQPVDFEKMVRNVVNDYQHQFKEKDIKLGYNYDKNLPKANLDKIRMPMVIQILLENATAYTKDKIDISIRKNKNEILFFIKDNGIGIAKEDLPYIFSKFYRSHDAYLTETEGEGIGLYLAKSIIDKHGGKISVYSKGEGKGSEFWIKLKI